MKILKAIIGTLAALFAIGHIVGLVAGVAAGSIDFGSSYGMGQLAGRLVGIFLGIAIAILCFRKKKEACKAIEKTGRLSRNSPAKAARLVLAPIDSQAEPW